MAHVANRKFDMPVCMKCDKEITFIDYLSADRLELNSSKRLGITNHQPDLKGDPVRFHVADFKRRKKDEKDSKFILSLSFPLYKDNKLTCSTLCVVLDKDIGPESDEDSTDLRRIFSILHIPLFNMSKTQFKNEQFRVMSAAEYMDYAAFNDPSLMLRLLYALATGTIELDIDKFKRSNECRSQFMAVAVAKELLQNITLGRPGLFPLMMAHSLEIEGVKDGLREYFSQIRLGASPSHMKTLAQRRIVAFEELHAAPDPLTAFSLHFDNIGFRGRTNKWSQHTVVQLKIITIEQLKKVGFYNGGKLSRKRKSFHQLAHDKAHVDMDDIEEGAEGMIDQVETLAKSIIAPTEDDKTLFSKRILTSIQCAIDLELPSYSECEVFDEDNDKNIPWGKSIPLNLGNAIKPPSNSKGEKERNVHKRDSNAYHIDNNGSGMAKESREALITRQPTLYKRNNIIFDKPLHEDPNKTATVKKIMDYLEHVSKWEPGEVDYNLSGGEPPVRDMIAPATSDGSPLIRFISIMDDDRREHGEDGSGRDYKRAQIFLGGMYYLMEFASMSNRLSRDFLTYFARQWRPTEPQLNWLLGVSDPTDYVLEMPQFLVAHYKAAADFLREKNPGINAVDVHKHMLKRAKAHPACMAILLNLRFIEIALMIRDSEKSGDNGDVDLFLTTMRLALPVLAASHAVNYVHICCEFLEWWELASEADKVFY